jgi:pimeloyl-ACP methyl ester carboxylesterase
VGRLVSLRTLASALGVACAFGAVAAPSQAKAARSAACTGTTTPGLVCSAVVVPLDRSGTVPGSITLHVETLPPTGPSKGAVFLIAGGPGQGSAHTFDLGSRDSAQLFRFLFPGYTLVAYDDRGTGSSGLLDCQPLQNTTTPDGEELLAAQCAASLGAGAPFYGTADHVEDLDAVRASLGVDKVALFGVSYGTKLALSYAAAHPTHVERLVLDSVLPPNEPDPFSANVAREMPAKLAAFCSGVCDAATHDFAGDTTAVANRLALEPVRMSILQPNGRTKTEKLDGVGVLSVVIDSDLSPALAAELPAAMHAARLGNMKPLVRLYDLDTRASMETAIDLSVALFTATVCRDGPFPWPADSSPSVRAALLQQAIDALPAGAFGPFGSWAAKLGNAGLCVDWPTPSGGASLDANPYPNVPLLALSGSYDMRTPTANAASVVGQFPQGHLLVVQGIGHSVATADLSGCSDLAVRNWILGNAVADTCPRPKFLIAPLAPYPGASTPRHLSPAATYAIAAKTLREAEAAWLVENLGGPTGAVAGLYAGKLTPAGAQGFKLWSYGIAPGVVLSGLVKITKDSDLPLTFDGAIKVSGRSASPGLLGLVKNGLRGTLGGKLVG